MDFTLPEAATAIYRDTVRFAEAELQDDVVARDYSSTFWREGWNRCARFGIHALPIPNAYGGRGADLTTTIAAMEALGYACMDAGLIFAINAHLWAAAIPILRFGSDEQKNQFLPGMCDGSIIAGNAASEPEAGSDIFGMQTSARREGDHYVLNGFKHFVSNAASAGVFVTYAVTRPKAGSLGISAFIVARDTPGLEVGRSLSKLGLRTAEAGEIRFTNCRVPAGNRLGGEGAGGAAFNCSMEWERGCILAMHLGIMQRQVERCVERARARVQFGRRIGEFQAVSHRIVDMKVRLEAARHLVYKIGWLKDRGKSAVTEAAIAKIFLGEAAVQSSLDAIQVFGGYGYLTDYEVERDLRDAVGGKLYSGTVEIQRNIVARMLGLPTM